jgi:hypothetical protein
MSLFDDLKSGNSKSSQFLGPNYPYHKYIKVPRDIGMSAKGDLKTLGKDVDGLIAYVEVLVTGKSKASATGGPLGNKYFLKTAAKCKPKDGSSSSDSSNNEVNRYIYISNVPDGNIPFISSGLGVNFSDFEGLVPGSLSDLNALNPMYMLQAFTAGSNPECQEITMETIDASNNVSSETQYVATVDIKHMDACMFPDRKNPVTNRTCKETFETSSSSSTEIWKMPNDLFSQAYFLILTLLAIYIFSKLINKSGFK